MQLPGVTPRAFLRITQVTLVIVVLNIVTGAAVRLSDSGLGCPDWPTCSQHRLTPALSLHPDIEFGNRLVVVVLCIATALALVAARRRSPRRRDLVWLSAGLLGGVIGEAVLGAVVVYTKLNPYVVMTHFMVGIALLTDAFVLALRAGRPDMVGAGVRDGVGARVGAPVSKAGVSQAGVSQAGVSQAGVSQAGVSQVGVSQVGVSQAGVSQAGVSQAVVSKAGVSKVGAREKRVSQVMLVLLAVVVMAGTATTGAGPHAGGPGAKRLPIALEDMTRIHSGLVICLVALTIALLYLLDHTGAPRSVLDRGRVLLAAMVIQGGIGYTQYFSHLPALLVGVHVLGVTVVWMAMLWFSDGLTHHGAVPRPDETAGINIDRVATDRVATDRIATDRIGAQTTTPVTP
ncbi:MAG TPA: COX15/CtaA family protein [Acidimicrobiales bacterium]|nr:COX15/CtaA family protein [Acidimicrobiales bacterium]